MKSPNADKHWDIVKKKFPGKKKSRSFRFIYAHPSRAKNGSTEMYYVIEGDNLITEEFDPKF